MHNHSEKIDVCALDRLGREEVIGFGADPGAYYFRLFDEQAVGYGVWKIFDDAGELGKSFGECNTGTTSGSTDLSLLSMCMYTFGAMIRVGKYAHIDDNTFSYAGPIKATEEMF